MKVSFYMPAPLMPSRERWIAWERGDYQLLEEQGKVACAQCWIFQTWLYLRNAGVDVSLVNEIPREGIVVAITGNIPVSLPSHSGLFVAGVVADGSPHPKAQLQIVQNAAHARRLPQSLFMPHWTQPGLVPRRKDRLGKFERVAFFGDRGNLAPELLAREWTEELRKRVGATFEVRGAARWHDYSDVDAVVAIRDFRRGLQLHKPAAKLHNAWLASVPFIGGSDSAYAANGIPGTDYLVARTPGEVLSHLERLKHDESFRTFITEQGRKKSLEFSREAITKRWRKLVMNVLPELAARRTLRAAWQNSCEEIAMRGVLWADLKFRS